MVAPLRALSFMVVFLGGASGARMNKREHRGASKLPRTCGQKAPQAPMEEGVNMSIINGRDAEKCAWPWQIYFTSCGGTLITPEWVVSAAHCGDFDLAYAGLQNRFETSVGQERTVVEQVIHPRYNQPYRAYENDIMMVRVDRPFELNECVNTACLPTKPPAVGSKCWISGWGTLASNGGPRPDILQEAVVEIKTNQECEAAYPPYWIFDDMVCAHGSHKGETTDACQGDSGGPMVCEEDGQWNLQGVTSNGIGCADPAYPGIWSRVEYNLDWVLEVVHGAAPAPPAQPPPTPPSSEECPVAFSSGPDSDGDCKCNG